MELLDKLVIPQPEYNLVLLNYFLMLGLSIFFIYTGALYGSMIMSVYFRGKAKGYNHFSFMTKDYADVATDKKSYGYGLGIVSFLSIIFIYAQLLHKTDVGVVSYLLVALVLYIAGMVTLFNYKSSLHLSSIFSNIKEQITGKVPESTIAEIDEINTTARELKSSAGTWGIILMSFAMWFFIGAIALTTDKAAWEGSSILTILISWKTILGFFQFLIASIALAGISFIFRKYYWDADKNKDSEDYTEYAKNFNLWLSIVTLIILPVFFLIGIFTTPKTSVSPWFFASSLLGIIAIFAVLHAVYGILKTKNVQLSKYAFFIFLVAFALLGIKEKLAFSVANHEHVLVLNEEYKIHKEEFLASMGVATVTVDGAEVYNRCMACHRDEDSPTAPAHKNIMAKYLAQEDPKAALARFIGNPVPVNPKWPPMPNQGLTPAEVTAVTEYLLDKYSDKKDESQAPADSVTAYLSK
ncbi:MAG: c-type cytochrome [Candidatus Kapabacteria bacterium]|nr:c-type cytochrome [Ignavibacteriota bacterium]MCW5885312.1 c-type cytochrome [Candidatus Kapabacteria bacterium]